jgi:hypothetical protein
VDEHFNEVPELFKRDIIAMSQIIVIVGFIKNLVDLRLVNFFFKV